MDTINSISLNRTITKAEQSFVLIQRRDDYQIGLKAKNLTTQQNKRHRFTRQRTAVSILVQHAVDRCDLTFSIARITTLIAETARS